MPSAGIKHHQNSEGRTYGLSGRLVKPFFR
jgi:hypothetical protein